MDKEFIDIIYDTISQYPQFSSKRKQDIVSTLQAISYKILQDTSKVDTLTVINIFCIMNNVKVRKDITPRKVLVRTR